MSNPIRQAQNVRPYRVPSVCPEPVRVESVSLDDFDIEEIREYLYRQDNHVPDSAPLYDHGRNNTNLVITSAEICRIETLALCGQAEHARAEIIRIVSDHIGRPL